VAHQNHSSSTPQRFASIAEGEPDFASVELAKVERQMTRNYVGNLQILELPGNFSLGSL